MTENSKFANLTVDYRKMLSIPIQDRVMVAKSSAASEIFGNMTPTEIARLFPTYYQKNVPQVASLTGSATSGYSAGGASGGGSSGSSGGGQAKADPLPPLSISQAIAAAADAKRYTSGKVGQYRPVYNLNDADLSDDVVNTIAGEALHGNTQSIDAVINNMLNRVGAQENWSNIHSVARDPGQYAGYRKADPEYAEFIRNRIKAIASGAVPSNIGKGTEFRAEYYVKGEGYGKTFERQAREQGYLQPTAGDNIHAETFAAGPYAPYAEPVDPENPNTNSETDATIEPLKTANNSTEAASTEPTFRITPENISTVEGLDPRIIEHAKTLGEAEAAQFYEHLNYLKDPKEINKAAAVSIERMGNYNPQPTAVRVDDAANIDPVSFWRERNPNGARIDDIDEESLRTAMMAAIKMEADHARAGTPKRVEFYGAKAGVRENPTESGSKHGLGFKEAIDFAIYDVDPKTGQKLANRSGAYGNYSNKPNHGGVDPDGFALYHELKQNQELARVYLGNQGDERYQNWGVRDGMLFSDVEWDAMHSDRSASVDRETGISTHTSPIGRGSVAYGLTPQALAELGIDPDSEAGQKLATGVAERFGDTKQELAASAKAAFGPPDVASDAITPDTPNAYLNPETGETSDAGIENLKTALPVPEEPVQKFEPPDDEITAEPVEDDPTAPVRQPTADQPKPMPAQEQSQAVQPEPEVQVQPAPQPEEDVEQSAPVVKQQPAPQPVPEYTPPVMALGGFIPEKDNLSVVKEETGETIAKINEGEIKEGVKPEGAGLRVESNRTRLADDLVNKYEVDEPEQEEPEQKMTKNETPALQSGMSSPAPSQAAQNIGYIPYQSPADIVHNSLMRAYDIDRRRTGYGNIS